MRNAIRFVPSMVGAAIALAATVASAEGTFFKNRTPAAAAASAAQPTAQQPPAAPPQSAPVTPQQQPEPSPQPEPTAQSTMQPEAQRVTGHVDRVVTTSTFVVAGRQLELSGVAGEPSPYVEALTGWLAQNGNELRCDPSGAKYRCVTSRGVDVGGVVIYNGAGKADVDAPVEYQNAQAQARAQRKGVWRQQ